MSRVKEISWVEKNVKVDLHKKTLMKIISSKQWLPMGDSSDESIEIVLKSCLKDIESMSDNRLGGIING